MLLLSDGKITKEKQGLHSIKKKNMCPSCQNAIQSSEKVCPYCQKQLEAKV
jgi:predicted amidophosphoribosyltransferase